MNLPSRLVLIAVLAIVPNLRAADDADPPLSKLEALENSLAELAAQKTVRGQAAKQRALVDPVIKTFSTDEKIEFLKWGSEPTFNQKLFSDVYCPYATTFLDDPEPKVQMEALRGLIYHSVFLTEKHLPQLKKLSDSTDADLRALALEALGAAGKADALDQLERIAAADPSVPARCGAIRGLAFIAGDKTTAADTRQKVIAIYTRLVQTDKNTDVRKECLKSSGHVSYCDAATEDAHRAVIDMIRAALDEKEIDILVRSAAAETFGNIVNSPNILPAQHVQIVFILEETAKSASDFNVRVAALQALASAARHPLINPAEASRLAQIVASFIDDKDETVRAIALLKVDDVHKHLDAKVMLPKLLKIAATTSNKTDARQFAVRSAAAFGDASINDKIAPLLGDKEPPVRSAALRALARLKAPNFAELAKPLLNDPDPSVRDTAAIYLKPNAK